MTNITIMAWRESVVIWTTVHLLQTRYVCLQYFPPTHRNIASQHCITVAFQAKFLVSAFSELHNLHTTCYYPIEKRKDWKQNNIMPTIFHSTFKRLYSDSLSLSGLLLLTLWWINIENDGWEISSLIISIRTPSLAFVNSTSITLLLYFWQVNSIMWPRVAVANWWISSCVPWSHTNWTM